MEYTDLEVWKASRALANLVYDLSGDFPKSEQYGLISQIRKSAISIPSNIAEGCGRRTSSESIHFLHVARGSLYELETQFYLAFDRNFITEIQFDQALNSIVECKKLLNGFINYYKKNNK